jgi:hypothetical protein
MRLKIAPWPPVLGLLAALLLAAQLVAGCVNKNGASDNDQRGGFYGGVSAGGTRP